MHHFIDEAGDLSLFNKRKQIVVGSEGVSNYFMVGVAHVAEPGLLEAKLAALRTELLADPLLNSAPSMDPQRRKTACCFHAKDDLAEVRHAVFKVLTACEIKVFVVIRDKRVLATQAQTMFRYGQKVSENDIYDDLLMRLMKDRLHLAEENHIVIAAAARRNARTRSLKRF